MDLKIHTYIYYRILDITGWLNLIYCDDQFNLNRHK